MRRCGFLAEKKHTVDSYKRWLASAEGELFRGIMHLTGWIVRPNLPQARLCYEKSMTDEAKYELAKMYLFGEGGSVKKEEARKLLEEISQSHQGASNLLGNLYSGDIDALEENGSEQMIAELTEKVIACYQKGGANGFYNLAKRYQENGEMLKALEYFEKATNEGHVYAAYARSQCYFTLSRQHEEGSSAQKSFVFLGEAWLERADIWDKEAAFETIKQGYGVNMPLFKEAVENYKDHLKKAENGDKNSLQALGEIYQNGLGRQVNEFTAYDYIKVAYDKGNLGGLHLASMYYWGEGVAIDYDVAEEICRKLLMRNKYDIGAKSMLGSILIQKGQHSEGVPLLQSAANARDALAAFELARFYHKKDKQKSQRCYQQAVISSENTLKDYEIYEYRILMYEIANAYKKGNGVVKNPKKAYQYYKQAAELGYRPAMVVLSKYFLEGIVVEKNVAVAEKWLITAYKGGSLLAPEKLGDLYLEGKYIASNSSKGLVWLFEAAKTGSTDAFLQIGHVYDVIFKEYDKAKRWYLRAIDKGSVIAALYLGRCYKKGKIDNQENIPFAKKYFYYAASKGDELAKNDLGELLTDDDPKSYIDMVISGRFSAGRGMRHLASRYERGIGVAKDVSKAVIWYARAGYAENNGVAMFCFNRLMHPDETNFSKAEQDNIWSALKALGLRLQQSKLMHCLANWLSLFINYENKEEVELARSFYALSIEFINNEDDEGLLLNDFEIFNKKCIRVAEEKCSKQANKHSKRWWNK